jgi:NTP pyrophosphatase (non-canonical NTP hydrolase)
MSFLEALNLNQTNTMNELINIIVKECHFRARDAGWWHDPATGAELNINALVPEKLLLIHSEVSEACEGFRKNLMDDKLPHRRMVEVELADTLIRIADLAGAMQLDLGGAVAEKLRYNASRADHKPENRIKAGGKLF